MPTVFYKPYLFLVAMSFKINYTYFKNPNWIIYTHLKNKKNYFRDPWNSFDFIIVFGSITDILYSELNVSYYSLAFPNFDEGNFSIL